METVKSVAVNAAVTVLVGFVLLLLVTVARIDPAPAVFGVTVIATNDVEPDCSVGIVQATLNPLGTLHVPDPAVALLKVAVIPVDSWPVTVMFVARSGPLLVTVKVIVTALPALITPEAGETVGATHEIHKSLAVRSFTANASLAAGGGIVGHGVPAAGFTGVSRQFWSAPWICRLDEVVSPAK
jgi:hypothetical protein